MALRRTTIRASTFFIRFRHQINPSTLIPGSATRYFTTSTTTTTAAAASNPPTASSDNKEDDSELNDPPVIIQGPPQKFKMENPFQSAGPRHVVEVDDVNGHTLLRIALPGVGDDGFKVWAEKNTVYFVGQGEVEYEKDECGRKYGGSLEFRPEEHRVDRVQGEIKNGILRLLVPTVQNSEQRD